MQKGLAIGRVSNLRTIKLKSETFASAEGASRKGVVRASPPQKIFKSEILKTLFPALSSEN